MVFPSARGVLVERGSLLSHAAIVARELGIPAIVSLPGVTRWLKDGDWVELDGSTGVVRRMSADAESARRCASEAAARADFSAIRYAQVWEDADVLLDGARRPAGRRLRVDRVGRRQRAGAADEGPARVIALDLSPAQLACLELRVAAYRELTHPELLELIGSRPSTRRDGAVRALPAGARRSATRAFWDRQPDGDRARHRRRRQVRALLRAVPQSRAAARPQPPDRRRTCWRRGPPKRGGASTTDAVGHLALAAAVPRCSSRAPSWAGSGAIPSSSATSTATSPRRSSSAPGTR